MNAALWDDAEVKAIASEIERYLVEHPRSKDNLAGIRTWWLADMPLPISPGKVHEAVERLVARGVVRKEKLPDGGTVYAAAGRDASKR